MALRLNDFDAGKSITRAIEEGRLALKISTFLGPNDTRFARCHFWAQKSLDFEGPPSLMALLMDVARIKIIMSHVI
jgi:hypothetical protein